MGDTPPLGPQAKYFPIRKTPMLPAGTFKGRTAVITGGGTGLGRGMAFVLSQLGASVAILGRRKQVLEDTAKEITGQTGNPVLPISVDVRNVEGIHEALNQIEKDAGLPTICVNNAAGNFVSPTERLSPNAFKAIIDIVLNGSAYMTLDLGKRLIAAQKGGSFLAITTTYTFRGSGFVVPSAAAKAGVENMMRSLASEWGRYGIRLNCITPGPFRTEGAWSRLDPTGEMARRYVDRVPAGRYGEVEELANLAAYMLSDFASFLTGESIVLDGGELPFLAGSFNQYIKTTKEEWDQMEKLIRSTNEKDKRK